MNAFDIVRDFEDAVAQYTGAPYAVAVNSCTNALLLACKYLQVDTVSIPKRTYVGVAQSILNAGGQIAFHDLDWHGSYRLEPYPIFDSARRFSSGMYAGGYNCVSFHIAKILGVDQGGAILHDDPIADEWFRRARFDGRTEGVKPKDDTFIPGFHCYLSPTIAAQGLWRMMYLPRHNEDLPNDDYGDLSQQEIFQTTPLKEIRRMRAKNNDRWMDAVEFLYKHHPEWARQWHGGVKALDSQISDKGRAL